MRKRERSRFAAKLAALANVYDDMMAFGGPRTHVAMPPPAGAVTTVKSRI